MIKFLLIVAVSMYLLYKIGSFFFRAGAASQQLRNFQDQQRKSQHNGQAKSQAQSKKEGKFNGGEYIDYEEVK